MIILGWICSILGAALSIFGIVNFNDANSAGYGLYKYADSSGVDNARILIIVGAIVFLFGITMLIIGYVRKSKNPGRRKINTDDLLNTKKCLNCGNIVPKNTGFCPKCGNNLNHM